MTSVPCTYVVLSFLRLSAGTAHGLTVIDYIQRTVVMTKCTLNANGKTLKMFLYNIGSVNAQVRLILFIDVM